jgi:hypothetical protein
MIRDKGKGSSSHLTWVCTSFGLESKGVVPIIICKGASKFGTLSHGNGTVLVAWFELEGQGRKPGPSLGVSPLGLGNELLHTGLDTGLDARYNVWGQGGVSLCTNWQFELAHDPKMWYHRQGFLVAGTRARKRDPSSLVIASRVFQSMDAHRFGTAAAAWLIKGQNQATIRAPWADAGVCTVV